VPFLFVLTVVVFVHEMGHYLVGRWCGIGVQAFSIGFGPELLGFNDRRGTRWKLSRHPARRLRQVRRRHERHQFKPDADGEKHLSPEERRIAFHTQPVWKRAATVFAGPAFNFLLTIAVFAVMFAAYGRDVREPMVAQVNPGSPAASAGFQPGDRFVSINGRQIETFDDVRRIVSGRAGDTLTFVMLRDGKDVTLTATPQIVEQQDALGNVMKVGVIGVVNDEQLGQPRHIDYGPVERHRRCGESDRPYHRRHRSIFETVCRRA
jgi:regulator of sigma E protease